MMVEWNQLVIVAEQVVIESLGIRVAAVHLKASLSVLLLLFFVIFIADNNLAWHDANDNDDGNLAWYDDEQDEGGDGVEPEQAPHPPQQVRATTDDTDQNNDGFDFDEDFDDGCGAQENHHPWSAELIS